LRYFTEPRRGRQLCADRRVTIVDRDYIAAFINESASQELRRVLQDPHDKVQAALAKARADLKKKDTVDIAEAFGAGALLQLADGLAQIAQKLDEASLKRVKEAADKESFAWLSFAPDIIRVGCPVTPECAKRIVDDPNVAAWLKDMRTLVQPLQLEAGRNGLTIVVGEKGRPIRFTFTDGRKHVPLGDRDLLKHVGNPGPVLLGGMPASAEGLIGRFVEENRKR